MLAIVVSAQLYLTSYEEDRTYRPTNAASITFDVRQEFPTGVFDLTESLESQHSNALDWISLSREVLPNATPLTVEERVSISEFFWSQFK